MVPGGVLGARRTLKRSTFSPASTCPNKKGIECKACQQNPLADRDAKDHKHRLPQKRDEDEDKEQAHRPAQQDKDHHRCDDEQGGHKAECPNP